MANNNPAELDLIPDLGDDAEEPAALRILRQQAKLIERKARHEVRAVVESGRSGSTTLAYNLVLAVPITGYRHRVLRIEFGIDGWPVDVSTPEEPTPLRTHDELLYVNRLREIFGREEFRRVVSHMRALYREESALSPAEIAVLGIFRKFKVGADEYLPGTSLDLSLQELPMSIIEDAQDAMEGLTRKGLVTPTAKGDDFVLTKKGAEIAYKGA